MVTLFSFPAHPQKVGLSFQHKYSGISSNVLVPDYTGGITSVGLADLPWDRGYITNLTVIDTATIATLSTSELLGLMGISLQELNADSATISRLTNDTSFVKSITYLGNTSDGVVAFSKIIPEWGAEFSTLGDADQPWDKIFTQKLIADSLFGNIDLPVLTLNGLLNGVEADRIIPQGYGDSFIGSADNPFTSITAETVNAGTLKADSLIVSSQSSVEMNSVKHGGGIIEATITDGDFTFNSIPVGGAAEPNMISIEISNQGSTSITNPWVLLNPDEQINYYSYDTFVQSAGLNAITDSMQKLIRLNEVISQKTQYWVFTTANFDGGFIRIVNGNVGFECNNWVFNVMDLAEHLNYDADILYLGGHVSAGVKVTSVPYVVETNASYIPIYADADNTTLATVAAAETPGSTNPIFLTAHYWNSSGGQISELDSSLNLVAYNNQYQTDIWTSTGNNTVTAPEAYKTHDMGYTLRPNEKVIQYFPNVSKNGFSNTDTSGLYFYNETYDDLGRSNIKWMNANSSIVYTPDSSLQFAQTTNNVSNASSHPYIRTSSTGSGQAVFEFRYSYYAFQQWLDISWSRSSPDDSVNIWFNGDYFVGSFDTFQGWELAHELPVTTTMRDTSILLHEGTLWDTVATNGPIDHFLTRINIHSDTDVSDAGYSALSFRTVTMVNPRTLPYLGRGSNDFKYTDDNSGEKNVKVTIKYQEIAAPFGFSRDSSYTELTSTTCPANGRTYIEAVFHLKDKFGNRIGNKKILIESDRSSYDYIDHVTWPNFPFADTLQADAGDNNPAGSLISYPFNWSPEPMTINTDREYKDSRGVPVLGRIHYYLRSARAGVSNYRVLTDDGQLLDEFSINWTP
jgi:hypothetical protein